jgi:hypothetical protein
MNRKSFGPGLAVLTLTAVLALAGARPAAAQDPGLFTRGVEWLAALWGATVQVDRPEARSMAMRTENATMDKGLGVDPNGGSILPEPPPVNGN